MTTRQQPDSLDSPSGVLAALSERQAVGSQVEIDKLVLAVEWAVMHPVESIDHAATMPGTEGELAIAGPGAPLVAEFCVAELALVLQMYTDAGRAYLGDAVELRYRLPKLWAVVTAGGVPVWKARRIAQATQSLSREAAAYVDTHVAPVARSCSFAQLDRTVEDAIVRFDPDQAEQRRRDAAEHRHFDIDLAHVTHDGTVRVDAEVDLADGLDLHHAITTGAAQLAQLGCEESLDVRRSMAAGLLARGQHTLDLDTGRDLTIYVHLSPGDPVAGVENTRSTVSVEQVKDWCSTAGTKVSIRPVIDLNDNLVTDSYTPTPRMREQAVLTNPVCAFPRCSRPSRRLDLDHIQPWDDDGATSSDNLAPLCRRHHRYKTHAGWTYPRTGPNTFIWATPYGYQYDTRH